MSSYNAHIRISARFLIPPKVSSPKHAARSRLNTRFTQSLISDLQPAALQAELSAFPELIWQCSAGTDHYIQNVTDTKVLIYLRSLFHSPPKSYPDATSAQSQRKIKTWLRNKSWSISRWLTVPSKWELIPSNQTAPDFSEHVTLQW